MTTLFETDWLPAKPFTSNNIKVDGVRRRTKDKAWDYKWVETHPYNYRNLMAFDIDDEQACWKVKTMAYDDQSIPEPSWVTTNPATGHAHVGYVLDAPVGSVKGLRYYDDTYNRLRAALGGDKGFAGRMTRNPLQHPTEWLSERRWTLKDLNAALPKDIPDHNPIAFGEDWQPAGRNDELFHNLRSYAIKAYRLSGWDENATYDMVEEQADILNALLNPSRPLPRSEVRSIVKSVTKWVFKKHSKAGFSRIQSERAKRRWAGKTMERDELALHLFEDQNFTYAELAENFAMTVGGAKGLIHRARQRRTQNLAKTFKLDK